MNRDRVNLLAGMLIIAAAASIVFIALKAANLSEIGTVQSYNISANFDNIGQLKPRSPVKSSGVLVGRVNNIELDTKNFVAVASLDIENKYIFPADSIFSIVSTNLLGDQYINIEAGGDEKNLADGAKVNGNSAIILEELISKFLFDKASDDGSL